MQNLIIIITLIIAIIGWFKPEKASRKVSVVMILLLISLAVAQSIIDYSETNEQQSLKQQLDETSDANESLLIQNKELLKNNSEFLKEIENYQDDIEKHANEVEIIRDYSSIAKLNPKGKEFEAGAGLTNSTAISRIIENAYKTVDSKIYCKCDSASKEIFLDVISKFPRFPFSYYCLGICMHPTNNQKAKEYMTKAIQIFEKTTKIADHNESHDQALAELKLQIEE